MKEPKKEANRWYLQAKDDYKFVNWILREGAFFDKGCFLSQQAGEKVIKACLYATGKRWVIGHSLYEMAIELVAIDEKFNQVVDMAKRLDRFYIMTRYPNGLPGGSPYQVFSLADLEAAYDDLASIFECSEAFLKQKGIEIENQEII